MFSAFNVCLKTPEVYNFVSCKISNLEITNFLKTVLSDKKIDCSLFDALHPMQTIDP